MRFGINIAREKWKLIFKLLLLYYLLTGVGVIIILITGNNQFLTDYLNLHAQYKYPVDKFYSFFRIYGLRTPILEEIQYRGPLWILAASQFRWSIGKIRLDILIFTSLFLMLNYDWADDHLMFTWPVFVAGIGWGWLVYKTRSLWPAIACHSLANVSIYFALRIGQLFITI